MALSVFGFLAEFLLQILVEYGFAKLFDDEHRAEPWIAIFLSFVVTVGLVMLVFFNHWFSTGAAWAFGAVVTILAVIAYLDYRWWREQRARISSK